MSEVPDLLTFAKQHPSGQPRCLLCRVPADVERQARAGKDAGVSYKLIAAWLSEVLDGNDYPDPITKGRLERHFQNGHTREDSD